MPGERTLPGILKGVIEHFNHLSNHRHYLIFDQRYKCMPAEMLKIAISFGGVPFVRMIAANLQKTNKLDCLSAL